MPKHRTAARSNSEREREHAEMLHAALARPGVREVMKVYQDWLKVDQGLTPYRLATKEPQQITTTNSANAR
jgi:hypothetical protein